MGLMLSQTWGYQREPRLRFVRSAKDMHHDPELNTSSDTIAAGAVGRALEA